MSLATESRLPHWALTCNLQMGRKLKITTLQGISQCSPFSVICDRVLCYQRLKIYSKCTNIKVNTVLLEEYNKHCGPPYKGYRISK